MTMYRIKINGEPFSEPIPKIEADRIFAAKRDCVKNIESEPVEVETKSVLQVIEGGKTSCKQSE